MSSHLFKDAFGWGFLLWLIGYVLGMILFAVVPTSVIGWVIMPIGVVLTAWVALRRVHGDSMPYYAIVALVWALLALIGDYAFIVKALKPADGYYKLDVYIYYALTLVIPLLAGWWRVSLRKAERSA